MSASEICIITFLLFIIYILFVNSCNEYFGSGPEIFGPTKFMEGTYYDNINLEPVYRENKLPTIYDI